MNDRLQEGLALFGDKKYKDAANVFTEIVQTDPSNHKAWHALGVALTKNGSFFKAEEAYERALLLDPGNVTYQKNSDNNHKRLLEIQPTSKPKPSQPQIIKSEEISQYRPTKPFKPGPQQYRRKCKNCGKVWHSLVSRENEILRNEKIYGWQSCFNTCNPSARAQYERNQDATQGAIDRLRSCPECKSTSYSEELISYEE